MPMLKRTVLLALALYALAPQDGPSPQVRALLQAFVAAVNSDTPEEWEAMAAAHFTPAFLAKQNPAERRALRDELRKEFGRIDPGEIRRRGPSAPLELVIEGPGGSVKGTIALRLEGFKIDGISVEAGGDPAGGFPPPPINGAMPPAQLSTALDGYLTKLAADDLLSGVVLVARDGKPIFEKAYGLADRAARVANTTRTRFNLGSINKTFTQVAVAQLVAREKLSYEAPLSAFIPEYKQVETRAATIQQLLTHAAGVADFFGPAFDQAPKDRFRSNTDYFNLVSSLPARFTPGARSEYCNGCYITLGEIIARASGMSYEDYVRDHIFKPAGMPATGYPRTDAIEPDVAQGYTRRGGDLRPNVFTRGAAGSAAGGGYSTAADLLAYDNALREGRLLDAAGTSRILRGAAVTPGSRAMGSLGIAGGAPGINALLESDGVWTVIVLVNLDPPLAEDLGRAIVRAIKSTPPR